MRSMHLRRAALLAAVTLMVGLADARTFAQQPPVSKLNGVINDYPTASGGWHINGEWSLHSKGASGRADFIASFAMVRSDLWVLNTGADPAMRSPHTHHIGLLDAEVTLLPNGLRLSGIPIVTVNGSKAFPESTLVVDIIGGDTVQHSNISMTFTGDAAGHFGTAPIDGVVVLSR